MTFGRNALIIIGIPIVGLGVYIFLFLSEGMFGECGNESVTVLQSPDGRYDAGVFIRNCGSTTDFTTILGLRSVLKDKDYSDVLVLKGKRRINVRWINSEKISVELDSAYPVFLKKNSFEKIKIEYK